MNISEEKKEPLRKYSRDQKKKMLVAYKFVNAQVCLDFFLNKQINPSSPKEIAMPCLFIFTFYLETAC